MGLQPFTPAFIFAVRPDLVLTAKCVIQKRKPEYYFVKYFINCQS